MEWSELTDYDGGVVSVLADHDLISVCVHGRRRCRLTPGQASELIELLTLARPAALAAHAELPEDDRADYPDDPAPAHGTGRRYRQHLREYDEPCAACRASNAERTRRWRALHGREPLGRYATQAERGTL